MSASVEKYHFSRNMGSWAIYRYTWVGNDGYSSTSDKIKNVFSYEEAVREVYHLNGWGELKSIRKSF